MDAGNIRRGRSTSKENSLKVKTLKFFLDWKESALISGKQISEATKIAESTISRCIGKDDMKLSTLADICSAFGARLCMRITRNGDEITDIMIPSSDAMHSENVLKRYIEALGCTIPEFAAKRKMSDQGARDMIKKNSISLKKLQEIAAQFNSTVEFQIYSIAK